LNEIREIYAKYEKLYIFPLLMKLAMQKRGQILLVIALLGILCLPLVCSVDYTVTRSFVNSSVTTDGLLYVTLTVDVGSSDAYAIDEVVPSGWSIYNAGGGNTSQSGHIKWLVCGETTSTSYSCTLDCCVSSIADTTYTYILRAPSTTGTGTFSGTYMFDTQSSEATTAGSTSMAVSAVVTPCTSYTAQATCNANTNCSWCSLNSACKNKVAVECTTLGCLNTTTLCTSSCILSTCSSSKHCNSTTSQCESNPSSDDDDTSTGGSGGSSGGGCSPIWSCTWGACENVNGNGVSTGTCTDSACGSASQIQTKQCRLPSTSGTTTTTTGTTNTRGTTSTTDNERTTTSGTGTTNRRTPSTTDTPTEEEKPLTEEELLDKHSASTNNMIYILLGILVVIGIAFFVYIKRKKINIMPSSGSVNLSQNMQAINKLQQQNKDNDIKP
jgi:LPXTG-motif cell wall-anchored protein